MVLLLCIPFCSYAQKKKAAKNKPVEQAAPKKDTIRIVYDTASAKPKEGQSVPLFKEKATIIPVKKKDSIARNKPLRIVYDTIKYQRKLTSEEQLLLEPVKDTVVYMGKDKRTSVEAPKKITVVKEEGSCKCVEMKLKAQDSVGYEDYVNYTFIFTNNCKDLVYVHSGSFRFSVANIFGHAVKRIRKVDFIKRFDYPEFVPLSPGETYEFRFADDPFFEFAMDRGQEYKFTFMYSNPSHKHRTQPSKTHLCTEMRDHNVYVR